MRKEGTRRWGRAGRDLIRRAYPCLFLELFPSIGDGAHRPLPLVPSVSLPGLTSLLPFSFPLVSCANGAPGLSRTGEYDLDYVPDRGGGIAGLDWKKISFRQKLHTFRHQHATVTVADCVPIFAIVSECKPIPAIPAFLQFCRFIN